MSSATPPTVVSAKPAHPLRRLILIGGCTAVVCWLLASLFVTASLTRRETNVYPESITFHNVDVQAIRLSTADGQELGTTVIPPQPGKPCVVLAHGLRSKRSRMRDQIRMLAQQGYGVIAISLRAHGDSSGKRIEFGRAEKNDVLAAVKYAQEHFASHPLFVFGDSLGAAAAIFAAGEIGTGAAGYVLDSPYEDLRSALWHRLSTHMPPPLAVALNAGMRLWAPLFLSQPISSYRPIDHIVDIPAGIPILLLAGGQDTYAPMDESQHFLSQAGPRGKMVIFPKATHGAVMASDPALYRRSVCDFIESAVHFESVAH